MTEFVILCKQIERLSEKCHFSLTDIDECTAGTDVCVSSSSDCMDFDGGYNCTCKTGYNQVDSLTCQGCLPLFIFNFYFT